MLFLMIAGALLLAGVAFIVHEMRNAVLVDAEDRPIDKRFAESLDVNVEDRNAQRSSAAAKVRAR